MVEYKFASSLPKQLPNVLFSQMLDETFFGTDDVGSDSFFALLVFQDFLLDGVFANHPIGKHFLVVTDAVNAVGGLKAGNPETDPHWLFFYDLFDNLKAFIKNCNGVYSGSQR